MIKHCRVDERLLHGQTVMSWNKSIGANCFLIADDEVASNQLRMSILRAGCPAGCKLVMKSVQDSIDSINSGVTDKYDLFIITKDIPSMERLVLGCDCIKNVNLGFSFKKPNSIKLGGASGQVYVDEKSKQCIRNMLKHGKVVDIQRIPNDTKIIVTEDLLNG